jgi:hypothetical protein
MAYGNQNAESANQYGSIAGDFPIRDAPLLCRRLSPRQTTSLAKAANPAIQINQKEAL